MRREIEAELLDRLPPEDPRARHSRADLRRLNWIMSHVPTLGALVRRVGLDRGSHSLADLGAGDGSLALRLVRRLRGRPGFSRVWLIDRNATVSAETQAGFQSAGTELRVVNEDVFAWLRQAAAPTVVMANLFLHHFAEETLDELLGLIAARARIFVACEPRRCWAGGVASRTLGLVGCNAVTRHDARVSVRAGFAGRELSARWPRPSAWEFHEGRAGLFSHAFLAWRKDAA